MRYLLMLLQRNNEIVPNSVKWLAFLLYRELKEPKLVVNIKTLPLFQITMLNYKFHIVHFLHCWHK